MLAHSSPVKPKRKWFVTYLILWPHILASFMMTPVQAAGYKMAPFMAVLLWLLNISFLTNRMRHWLKKPAVCPFYILLLSTHEAHDASLLWFSFKSSPQGGWQDLLDEQRVLGNTLHGFQQEAAHGHALRLRVGHTFLKPNKQCFTHCNRALQSQKALLPAPSKDDSLQTPYQCTEQKQKEEQLIKSFQKMKLKRKTNIIKRNQPPKTRTKQVPPLLKTFS